MAIIGYDGAELGGSATAETGWNAQCFADTTHTYVATSDAAITSVSVYGDGPGNCEIGVYVISGGVPTTRVTPPITVNIGSGEGWHSTNCRIPLVDGVRYGVAIHYVINDQWNMRYGSVGGTPMSNHSEPHLTQAWSQVGTDSNAIMFYATVNETVDYTGGTDTWSLVSSVSAGGGGAYTTSAINTTGADLLVVNVATTDLVNSSLTDSKSNTWVLLARSVQDVGSHCNVTYYCANPTVGSGHTFSSSSTSLVAAAFSGASTTPLEMAGAQAVSFAASVKPGALVAAETNMLVVSGFGYADGTNAAGIDASFTIVAQQLSGAAAGGGLAYKIVASPASQDPTWNGGAAINFNGATIASFKAGSTIVGDDRSGSGAITEADDVVTGIGDWSAQGPEYIQGQSAAITSSRSPSVTFGAGVQTGDLVYFYCSTSTATSAATAPSGWVNVLATSTTIVTSDANTAVGVYHIVTSGENGQTTFTCTNLFNATATGNVLAAVIRGVDLTTPNDNSGSTFNSTNTITPHVLAAITGTSSALSANSLVVRGVGADANTITYTTPTGHTVRQTSTSTTGTWLGTRDAYTTANTDVTATNITPSAGDEYVSISVAFAKITTITPITGTGAITEAHDTVTGIGDWTGNDRTGSGTPTEADDAVAGTGDWTAPAGGAHIGYDVEGGDNATTDGGWADEATVGTGWRYVASSGDTVTEVAVFASGAAGACQVGVYTYVGGVPVTRVGTANITITATGTAQWFTQPASIALTNGVEYVAAIDYAITPGWNSYFDEPGGTQTSADTIETAGLPATWTEATPTPFLASFYATVTGAPSGDVIGSGATTEAHDSTAGTGIVLSSDRSGSGAITEADDTVAAIGSIFAGRYPASVSGRKLLDQHGQPYLAYTFSSWRMASRLSNANITVALEDAVENHFNGVTVWMGGVEDRGGFGQARYTNLAGQNFWANPSTPWDGNLGPAWASVDHLMSEAARLGIVVHFSFCGGNGSAGCGPDWVSRTLTQMYNTGVALATRYAAYPNLVWHIMFDDGPTPTSPQGAKIDELFRGINDTETAARRPVRWLEPNNPGTGYWSTDLQDWYDPTGATTHFRCTINTWYSYFSNSAEIAETGWAETSGPVGDCEPVYVGAPHYSGNSQQQLRERNYATFIEGGCIINFGHEDWWPFGADGLYSGGETWDTVVTDDETRQAGYAWQFIDEHLRSTAYAPVTTLVTTGDTGGAAETKAAQGASTTVAVAYFPDNRTIAVNTTILTGITSNVRLRWYDPTADPTLSGSYTLIAIEAKQTARSVTLPAARGDGTRDYVLLVDTPGTDDRSGSSTITETDDTVTGVGAFAPARTGSGATTEADDVVTGIGDWTAPAAIGSGAITEADDVAAGVGDYTSAPITGSSTITEADDTVVAVGVWTAPAGTFNGSGTIIEVADTAAGVGDWTAPARTGTGSFTEADDTTAGLGIWTAPPGTFTGSAAITETTDLLVAAGVWTSPPGTFAGSAAITETGDTVTGSGDWTGVVGVDTHPRHVRWDERDRALTFRDRPLGLIYREPS